MTTAIIESPPLRWQWGERSGQPPTIEVGTTNQKYKRQLPVDPAPAYRHSAALVAERLTVCVEKFPLGLPLTLYLPDHDVLDGSNGLTLHEQDWDAPADAHKRHPQLPIIVLFGKRVPPHPAMTRYLVAHEYGHAVEMAVGHRQFTSHSAVDDLRAQYAAMRGLAMPAYYGPGTWHVSPGEVFACDFRILVAGAELEFWPHGDVPRPELVPAVREWWAQLVQGWKP